MNFKHWCKKCDIFQATETKTCKRVVFNGEYDKDGCTITKTSFGPPFCPECGEEMITCEKVQQ